MFSASGPIVQRFSTPTPSIGAPHLISNRLESNLDFWCLLKTMNNHAYVGSLQCAIQVVVWQNLIFSSSRDPEMERLKVAHLKQNQVVLELK